MEDAIGPLNHDDLYTNFCTGNATLDAFETVPGCVSLGERTERYLNVFYLYEKLSVSPPNISYHLPSSRLLFSCLLSCGEKKNPAVQQALQAHPSTLKWYSCVPKALPDVLSYNLTGMNMMNYYNFFFENAPHLRILIYSGGESVSFVCRRFWGG